MLWICLIERTSHGFILVPSNNLEIIGHILGPSNNNDEHLRCQNVLLQTADSGGGLMLLLSFFSYLQVIGLFIHERALWQQSWVSPLHLDVCLSLESGFNYGSDARQLCPSAFNVTIRLLR